MIYRVFHPVPALCHVVDHYWYASSQKEIKGKQHFYTPLLQTLAFNFKQKTDRHTFNGKTYTLDKPAYLFGQGTSYREIYTEGNGLEMFGVKFKATGIAQLTGIPMTQIANTIIPLEAIWGREIDLLCDEIQSASNPETAVFVLEKFLLREICRVKDDPRIDGIRHAVHLIEQTNGLTDIGVLREQIHASRKTFERTFVHYIGLMPKVYSSITQFNAAKALMNMQPLLSVCDIALETGYYDNSHFSAAFKRFCGFTPTVYLEMQRTQCIENAYFRDINTESL